MRGFKNFAEGDMGPNYWADRLAQFQAAAGGQKNVITPEPNKQPPKYKSDPLIRRPIFASNILKSAKVLSPQEVQSLGIHANHNLVWIGSTADAPASYPYVYVKLKNKFFTNPNHKQ